VRARRRLATAALLVMAAAWAAAWSLPGSAAEVSAGSSPKAAASTARVKAAGRDSVLAKVGRVAITRREVQKRIDDLPEPYRTNYGTPDGRRQFLDRLIEERVWLMGARKHGVGNRPEVRRQLEQSERELLIRTYVNEIMAANPAPSDSEARVFYDTHPDDYRVSGTVTLSHIQVKTEAEAKRVKQWAQRAQDWKKLVDRYSTDSLTKAGGGNLGTVTRQGMFGSIGSQPALAESAFALGQRTGPGGGVGAIGGPFRTDHGWHIIRIDGVKPESMRPFDQARQMIQRQLAQTRNQDFYRMRLALEKASLGFTIDSAAVNDFVAQKKTAQELFRAGQEAGPATDRIAAYQELLKEYPDSDVSPQAQFMIGFIYSEELKNYDEADKAFRQLLARYPKAELADSARWMLEHMRNQEAPAFMNPGADSSATAGSQSGARRSSDKP
jgi:peptidyl-prolyl cis-trans isomerase C